MISASEFVVWAGFGAIIPYLPLFLEEQAHTSMTLWAVIAAMFYVGTLLFSSPLGWLSDTIGRKPVMVGGAIVYTVALLLFTTTTDPYWFILFRLLEGVGTAAFGPAAQAFVADITTEENRSKAYGFLTTAQFGGLIVGPALAAPLYALGGGGTSGFYAIFYFGAILSGLALAAIVLFVREPAALKTRRTQRRREREAHAGWRVGAQALQIDLHAADPRLRPHRVHQPLRHGRLGRRVEPVPLPPRRLQDVHQHDWVAFSVPMLLSFVGGMFADRHSRFWLFVVGYALSSFAWMFYGISTNLVALIVVNVLEGFAIAFSYPAKQAFLIQVSPRRWLGTVTGVEATSMQLAGLLGSLTAPLMYARISGQVLTFAGIFALAGLAVAAPILYRAWKRLQAAGDMPTQAELGRLADGARTAFAAEPPRGPE